jgi:hypothetical protein
VVFEELATVTEEIHLFIYRELLSEHDVEELESITEIFLLLVPIRTSLACLALWSEASQNCRQP